MSDAKAESHVPTAELPMLRAYRLWFEHTRKCDGCKGVRKAQEGCETGRELWGRVPPRARREDVMTWEIKRTPGSRVHRTDDDHVAVPLRLSRNGEHATDTELCLSLADAEHLHAALCRALDGYPAPSNAPECRKGAGIACALSSKVAEANRRSRRAL
ncbi:hypothetical protein [Streptomyces sp. SA15]|uniref:hypothetical protein n=1 Tax=Streptomyces sp. SA15 TaxID=934019 RepID=UPI0015CC2217|nr:hypothetical protein [Streptomyces sp. SA15]